MFASGYCGLYVGVMSNPKASAALVMSATPLKKGQGGSKFTPEELWNAHASTPVELPAAAARLALKW
jgi:hypothetical protein